MKLLRQSGVGVTRRHVEHITQEEDLLWEKQLLGDHNRTVLASSCVDSTLLFDHGRSELCSLT